MRFHCASLSKGKLMVPGEMDLTSDLVSQS